MREDEAAADGTDAVADAAADAVAGAAAGAADDVTGAAVEAALARALADPGWVVLDGGLATELEARGHDLTDALWSARLLLDEPEAIAAVHRDYLAAGADIIISASYQATVEGFRRRGCSPRQAADLIRRSVELARTARDAFWTEPANRRGRRRPWVAASVGPWGAALADGSEYRGDYGVSPAHLADFHRSRLALLAAAGADLLAIETIPSAREARVLADLLRELPAARATISFTLRDEATLSDGTPLAAIAAELDSHPQLLAIGVNCVPPTLVEGALTRLRAATAKPLVAYPNSGEVWDPVARRWRDSAEPTGLADLAPAWHAAGARLVGGCCRTAPADIHRLRRRLAAGLV